MCAQWFSSVSVCWLLWCVSMLVAIACGFSCSTVFSVFAIMTSIWTTPFPKMCESECNCTVSIELFSITSTSIGESAGIELFAERVRACLFIKVARHNIYSQLWLKPNSNVVATLRIVFADCLTHRRWCPLQGEKKHQKLAFEMGNHSKLE